MVAAGIQDDLEHVVGYTIIADAGFAILGLAALDPRRGSRPGPGSSSSSRSAARSPRGPSRSAARSGRGGSPSSAAGRVRAPLLAVALVLIAAAAVGWPGLVAWEARASLVDLTIAGPIGIIVVVSSVAQLAIYGRLLLVGLSKPSAAVVARPQRAAHLAGHRGGTPMSSG